MKLGLSFPHNDIGADPGAVRDFLQTAEGLGYDFVSFVDHVLCEESPRGASFAAGYSRSHVFHEVMVLMGYAAACTDTLGLATAILILPQRQAVLVAKQAAEIDVLSGGRLRLGVGLGWNRIEFDGLGAGFSDRARRLPEQIDLMRRLWTERTVAYDGAFHGFESAGINPEPVQRPIPVWIGAMQPPAVRRAARIADGWFMYPRQDPDDAAAGMISLFRQAAAEAGREPDRLGVNATVFASQGRGPDDWLRVMERWQRLGVDELTFRTTDSGLPDLAAHIDAIRALGEAR